MTVFVLEERSMVSKQFSHVVYDLKRNRETITLLITLFLLPLVLLEISSYLIIPLFSSLI